MVGASNIEVANIGENRARISEAEKAGVKSVPALVAPNGNILHINLDASPEGCKRIIIN